MPIEKSKNPAYEQIKNYVLTNDIQLGNNFTQRNDIDIFPKEGRKTPSVYLNGNTNHFKCFVHANGTKVYYFYVPRFQIVHRVLGKIKKALPGYKRYSFKESTNPALEKIREYMPEFVKSKQDRETFISCFIVFYKDPTPFDHLIAAANNILN